MGGIRMVEVNCDGVDSFVQCAPNCYSKILDVEEAGAVRNLIVLIARRDIGPGEELT